MPKVVDAAQKRAELADATWRVIGKEGFPAVTLRRIAREANCTTGALSRYFSNREALLIETLRTAHDAATSRMVAKLRITTGDFERLEAIVLEALPLDPVRLREWKTRLVFWSAASENDTLREENVSRFQRWGELLEELLAPIVRRTDIARRESELIRALVDGFALRLVLHGGGAGRLDDDTNEVLIAVRSYLRDLQRRYA